MAAPLNRITPDFRGPGPPITHRLQAGQSLCAEWGEVAHLRLGATRNNAHSCGSMAFQLCPQLTWGAGPFLTSTEGVLDLQLSVTHAQQRNFKLRRHRYT